MTNLGVEMYICAVEIAVLIIIKAIIEAWIILSPGWCWRWVWLFTINETWYVKKNIQLILILYFKSRVQ